MILGRFWRFGARAAAAVCAVTLAGCLDTVEPGFYAPDDPDAGGADGPSLGQESPSTSSKHGGASDASAAGHSDGGSSSAQPSGPCDLTGHWLLSLRTVTQALGTSQAAHEWYYYEMSQSGTAVTVSKGLVCGMNVRALSAVGGNVDIPKTWPAMVSKMSHTGRTGTSTSTSGKCKVAFEQQTEAMGATQSYYLDSSHDLPAQSDKASGSKPGWEDWDNDGQPGYTMAVSGIATGQIYMVSRTRYAYSGTVAASADTFDLLVDWSSDQDVLGVNGPPILSMTASAVKDSDATQHFVTFARIDDSQASGSDADICASVRSLAPKLAMKANN